MSNVFRLRPPARRAIRHIDLPPPDQARIARTLEEADEAGLAGLTALRDRLVEAARQDAARVLQERAA